MLLRWKKIILVEKFQNFPCTYSASHIDSECLTQTIVVLVATESMLFSALIFGLSEGTLCLGSCCLLEVSCDFCKLGDV